MIELIRSTLFSRYGLTLQFVSEVEGGWSASAFVAHTNRGKYFVKVYERRRPSVWPLLERMVWYMPVVLWLSQNTSLSDRMVAPILTKDGDYQVEYEEATLVIFPFVEGQPLGETKLTSSQITQIAEILALLHSYGAEIPVPTKPLMETYALPFLDSLEAVMHATQLPPALSELLQVHFHKIRNAMTDLKLLAKHMDAHLPHYALCHSDVHGGNLMWSNRLILIDWEGLRLAPVESDLFFFTNGFFFDDAKDELMAYYRKLRPEYAPDGTAMRFYRLRRRMEDIAEFCHSIAEDRLSPPEFKRSLCYLQKECTALDKYVTHPDLDPNCR